MKVLVRIVVVLGFAAVVSAQLPEAWQNWRFSAPVDTAGAPAKALVSALVPVEVTRRSREGWTDVRVIDAQAREVPFVLHARLGGTSFDRRHVPLLEPSGVDGKYQQAVADAGAGGAVHNSVRLQIDTTQNLMGWVQIAVSGDLKDWRVVRERAPIYVLRVEGMGDNTDVSYPDSVSRYVRIRVSEASGTYKLESAELGRETSTIAERVPSGIDLVPATNPDGSSVWTSDGDASALLISAVEFTTAQSTFVRAVVVESNSGGDRWDVVTTGDILRARDAAGERAWLLLKFSETQAPRWRVTIYNRSDASIADLRPVLLTTPRRIVFKVEAGESYRVLYGNPRAQAPRYDLAQLTDAKMIDAAAPAAVGAAVENPAWVDPSPWTERYEAVLWVALGLAVVILGAVAVRTMRSSGA